MNRSRSGPNRKLDYGLALILGVLVSGAILAIVAPLTHAYRDSDGASYVEAARNMLAGKGLLTTARVFKWPVESATLSLWPPGFPLMVALGAKLTGLDPFWAAAGIAWLSWALLPAALLFTLRPILQSRSIYIISALVMLAPGAIDNAWQPMTDEPFLLITVISFGLLFRGSGETVRPSWLLLSGVAVGGAYAVRNVGVATIAAFIGAYVGLALLRVVTIKAATERLLWWALGAGCVIVPLLAWNLWEFGALQPYKMPPSHLGLLVNVRYFFAALSANEIALHGLVQAIVWSKVTFLAPIAVVAAAAVVFRKRLISIPKRLSRRDVEILAVLGAYVIMGAIVLILARTRYQWGEFIGTRHILQYDWILMAFCALIVERWGQPSRATVTACVVAFVTLAGFRLYYAAQEVRFDLASEAIRADLRTGVATTTPADFGPFNWLEASQGAQYNQAVMLALHADPAMLRSIGDLPKGTVLFSNYSDALRVLTGRIVHPITLTKGCVPSPISAPFAGAQAAPQTQILLFPELPTVRSGCWRRLATSPYNQEKWPVRRSFLIDHAEPG
jgi:hypothetical protein